MTLALFSWADGSALPTDRDRRSPRRGDRPGHATRSPRRSSPGRRRGSRSSRGRLRDAIHLDRRGEAEYAAVAGDTKAYLRAHRRARLGGGGRSRAAAASPFLIPAAEAAKQHIDDRVGQAFRNLKCTTAAILETIVKANTTAAVRDLRQYDSLPEAGRQVLGFDHRSDFDARQGDPSLGSRTALGGGLCRWRRCCLRLDRPGQGSGHHHPGSRQDHGGAEPQPRLHGQGGLTLGVRSPSRATSTPSR